MYEGLSSDSRKLKQQTCLEYCMCMLKVWGEANVQVYVMLMHLHHVVSLYVRAIK